ncbi:MAG: hypothetical protein V3V01_12135 [Acidimicrobiales bacterium]
MLNAPMSSGEEIDVTPSPKVEGILTPGAIAFVGQLERRFRTRRAELLESRRERLAAAANGETAGYCDATATIREGEWTVVAPPTNLFGRSVELLAATDPAVALALNIVERLVIADFEPADGWQAVLVGHAVVKKAMGTPIRGGGSLVVRPRPWDVDEPNFIVDGRPVSATLFDFAMTMYHCAKPAIAAANGPYFDLPGTDNHLEARLWSDVFCAAQDQLSITRGQIKAIVAVETELAMFELDEILYEVRDHSAGLRVAGDEAANMRTLAACNRRGAPSFLASGPCLDLSALPDRLLAS